MEHRAYRVNQAELLQVMSTAVRMKRLTFDQCYLAIYSSFFTLNVINLQGSPITPSVISIASNQIISSLLRLLKFILSTKTLILSDVGLGHWGKSVLCLWTRLTAVSA